jgi:hypothetical protein
MWLLRAYDVETDGLQYEQALPWATSEELELLIGRAPTQWGSTPISPPMAASIGLRGNFVAPRPRGWEYFLDFESDSAHTRNAATSAVASS